MKSFKFGKFVQQQMMQPLFFFKAPLLGFVALLFTGLTIPVSTPPGMKQISGSDKFMDVEEVSLIEYAAVVYIATQKDGKEAGQFLAPDTTVLEKLYGARSTWNDKTYRMPIAGLHIQQIERYCDYRRLAVLEFNGMDVHYELPHKEDLKPFQPKVSTTPKPITSVDKASKVDGFKGLYSNIPEVCIGDETIYGAFPDGSLRPVPVDSTLMVGFRCIATFN